VSFDAGPGQPDGCAYDEHARGIKEADVARNQGPGKDNQCRQWNHDDQEEDRRDHAQELNHAGRTTRSSSSLRGNFS
jgi:hypothetical protein